MNEKITVAQLTKALQSPEVLKNLRFAFDTLPAYLTGVAPLPRVGHLSESTALMLADAILGALYPKPSLETVRLKVRNLRKNMPWPAFGLSIDNEFTRQQARDAYNAAIDEVLSLLGES